MKKYNTLITVFLIIFVVLWMITLITTNVIGGCNYADINLTITEVIPSNTIIDLDCSGILVNGEYYYGGGYAIEGDTHPSSLNGKADISIKGETRNRVSYNAEGYTTYNSYGKLQKINGTLSNILWIGVLVLLIAKIIVLFEIKQRKDKQNIQ